MCGHPLAIYARNMYICILAHAIFTDVLYFRAHHLTLWPSCRVHHLHCSYSPVRTAARPSRRVLHIAARTAASTTFLPCCGGRRVRSKLETTGDANPKVRIPVRRDHLTARPSRDTTTLLNSHLVTRPPCARQGARPPCARPSRDTTALLCGHLVTRPPCCVAHQFQMLALWNYQ